MLMKRLVPLILLLTACGGCDALGYLGYLVAPNPKTRTVEPEFDGLKNCKVAVAVYANGATLHHYQRARLELPTAIAHELRHQLKDVTVIEPVEVLRYQDANFDWESGDRGKLAADLGADYVLYLALIEYTTSEMGGANVYRGRITAESSLYRAGEPESNGRVWHEPEIRVTFPEDAPAGHLGESDAPIRYQTHKLLADKLVKNFYQHEVPLE
jgi:hypothetical protein